MLQGVTVAANSYCQGTFLWFSFMLSRGRQTFCFVHYETYKSCMLTVQRDKNFSLGTVFDVLLLLRGMNQATMTPCQSLVPIGRNLIFCRVDPATKHLASIQPIVDACRSPLLSVLFPQSHAAANMRRTFGAASP